MLVLFHWDKEIHFQRKLLLFRGFRSASQAQRIAWSPSCFGKPVPYTLDLFQHSQIRRLPILSSPGIRRWRALCPEIIPWWEAWREKLWICGSDSRDVINPNRSRCCRYVSIHCTSPSSISPGILKKRGLLRFTYENSILICVLGSVVEIANLLTEVINFKWLVDNFRISFCPDTGAKHSSLLVLSFCFYNLLR